MACKPSKPTATKKAASADASAKKPFPFAKKGAKKATPKKK